MKTVACTALLYGKEYLEYAIRSVIDAVDEYWVLATVTGSHGHSTNVQNPEHIYDLYEIARKAAGDKFHWYMSSPGQWRNEGEQRDYIRQLAPDADIYLTLDADEIWPDGLAAKAISEIQQYGVKEYRIPLYHLWRSFHRAVVNDEAAPGRLYMPTGNGIHTSSDKLLHFGYAQSSEIVDYKQTVHGHRAEWRSDWFDTKWVPNAQVDVHPTNLDYWHPVEVDPDVLLPEYMREHPFYDLDVIP